MKIGNVIIVAALAALAFLLFGNKKPEAGRDKLQTDAQLEKPRLHVETPAAAVSTPVPQHAFTPQELYSVRGTVVGKMDVGLVVDCMGPISSIATQWAPTKPGAPVKGDAGDSQRAKLLEQQKNIYGPLLILSKGAFRKADWEPSSPAAGRITLTGFSADTGTNISVIAAPVGPGLYTADFTMQGAEPHLPPSWMNKPGKLDRQ